MGQIVMEIPKNMVYVVVSTRKKRDFLTIGRKFSQNPVNTEKDMEKEKNDISLLSYTMLTDKAKIDDNPYKNKQICIIYGKGYQRIIISNGS
jgi:hypothetical protein